ncbi:chondroitin AC/alginate lyase [Ceratobasidium sp. AG-Ba]|nr:chondroitin AC/alginate lyase [Ceratobasidium sp. AG-Ba]QRW12314.1 chondroitin AC/alginate lyase [Ceratobasidium sp. AG-Ba]
MRRALFTSILGSLAVSPSFVAALTSYANEFVDPEFFLAKKWSDDTQYARQAIVTGAQQIATEGPWTVTSKNIMPPSNNTHDYLSWTPYLWPDCSKVGNTTELSPEQIWVTCPYVNRDGQFNPDVRQVNDTGHFQAMSDSVFFNAMAWVITGDNTFASNAANEIKTWFIDPATSMNPNLNYAQLERGPGEQVGQHTGILDLKCMTKLVSGVLMMRNGSAPAWTSDLDTGLNTWVNQYIQWLDTAKLSQDEKASTNNHGSFWFNQYAALQILVGDAAGAKATIQEYFSGIYMNQIDAKGDQPLETARTRPYHYRAYNLAAMIVNARLGQFVGFDAWNLKTTAGAGIQDACNYAMNFTATQSGEDGYDAELYPNVAAVAAHYGDPDGKYAKWLAGRDQSYPGQPYFLWDQPLTNSGLSGAPTGTASSAVPSATSANGGKNGAVGVRVEMSLGMLVAVAFAFATLL